MEPKLEKKLRELLERLAPDRAAELLAQVRALSSHPAGKSSPLRLLRFVGCIDADDLDVMQDAIDEGCERVDVGE